MHTCRCRPNVGIIVLSALLTSGFSRTGYAVAPPPHLGLCASCHGERGKATTPAVPNLAGQNLDYLRGAIEQYRSGKRDVAAMRAVLGMLGAADVDRVLEWYAAQPALGRRPRT